MSHVVGRWRPARALVCVAASRDAVLAWLHQVRAWPRARLITRLRRDAALYEPPPTRQPGPRGRPRLNGARRPPLAVVLADAGTPGSQLTIAPWSGDGPRQVDVTTDTAGWDHAGQPPVPIRWVLSRDPAQSCEPQALRSTNLRQTPEQLLPWCIRRWTMDVTREAARAQLGLEPQRQWNDQAMARPTPAWLRLPAIVPLTAQQRLQQGGLIIHSTAW